MHTLRDVDSSERFELELDDFPTIDRRRCQSGPAGEMGRRLLREIVADCAASDATLWLISEDEESMLGTLNCSEVAHIIENASVPIDASVVGMVASTGSAASIGPDEDYNPSIDEKAGTKTESLAAAPVRVRGSICGVVSVINPLDGEVFSQSDLEVLEWKAHLMGLVLADCLV